jgi:hypothetical protein
LCMQTGTNKERHTAEVRERECTWFSLTEHVTHQNYHNPGQVRLPIGLADSW